MQPYFSSVVSFLVSSIIGALLTVALTAIAAVDLGSIYKCPKEDYRSSPFYPAYCSKFSDDRFVNANSKYVWMPVHLKCVDIVKYFSS